MPDLTTQRGLKWHYEMKGQGETIVFLHGFGVSSRLWADQIEHFSKFYQVLALDLPGHGQSSWQPVSLSDMGNDLKEIFKSLDIDRMNFVGSSFGGLVGLSLLNIYPECVQRLILVGSLPKFARTEDYPAGLDVERIKTLSGQFNGDYAKILDIFFRSLFSRQDRESERFKWIKQFHRSETVPQREALKNFLDIIEKEDLRDVLARVNCRVQYIGGSEDYICPAGITDWLQEMLPYAQFEIIKGTGHFPFLTKPKEFNQLLEGFLMS